MKNLILATILLAMPIVSFAVAAPKMQDNFTGFNVGIGNGVSALLGKEKLLTTSGFVFDSNDRGALGYALKVLAGYNVLFSGRWLVGGEVHYQYNTADIVSGLFGNKFSGKTTVKNMWGAALILGYLTSPNVLWFVSVGPEVFCYKHTYNLSGPFFIQKKEEVSGQIGLGTEQALNAHWSLGESMHYTFEQEINFNDLASVGFLNEHKVGVLTAMINVLYFFKSQ